MLVDLIELSLPRSLFLAPFSSLNFDPSFFLSFFVSFSLSLYSLCVACRRNIYWKATNHINQWRSLQAPPEDFPCSKRSFHHCSPLQNVATDQIDDHHSGPATAKPIATDLLSGMN